jgi:hypothetical protein
MSFPTHIREEPRVRMAAVMRSTAAPAWCRQASDARDVRCSNR